MYMRIFLIIFAINPVIPEFVSLNQRHELQKYQKSSNLMMDQSEKVLRRKKRWDHYSHKVQENLKNREKINTFVSSHHGTGITYSIEGEGANTIFQIDNKTGELFAVEPLDRENKSSYHLYIFAKDKQGRNVEDPANETINVGDENDNAPFFPPGHIHATVPEVSANGTFVTTVTANDEDDPSYSNGELEYSLVYPNSKKFSINSKNGEVRTATNDLDYEAENEYELVIQVRDAPGSSLFYSATTTLTITLLDVNDKSPEFTELVYDKSIPENAALGTEILLITVTDEDHLRANTDTKFSIKDGIAGSSFVIETEDNIGILKVKKLLDYETALNHSYNFIVEARNVMEDPHIGPMLNITTVTVHVTNVNEAPEFKPQAIYYFKVKEDCEIGAFVNKVSAVDPEGDSFGYWMVNHSDKFEISAKSGNMYVKGNLDREKQEQYKLWVAAGSRDLFSTAKVIIEITDVNDNPPIPLDKNSLDLVVCENTHSATQALQPKIYMKDRDTKKNSYPFDYFPLNDPIYKTDFELRDNKDNTATLYTLHENFDIHKREIYKVPFMVQDNGQPRMNASYVLEVRVCFCINGSPSCDKALHTTGINILALAVILSVCLLLLIITAALIVVRRRQTEEDPLIKQSSSSLEIDARENFIEYREEGGEEDTDAFDLGVLQQRDSTESSSSGSSNSFYPNVKYCPSLKRQFGRNFSNHHSNFRPVLNQDLRNCIESKKITEDEKTLPFDSLQMYAYEGEDSCAGSLSSLCSSSDNNDQDYDYLKEWGPRFKRLANMYGTY